MKDSGSSFAAAAAVSVVVCGLLLAGCAPPGTPVPSLAKSPEGDSNADAERFTLGIGIAGDLEEVAVDAEVTRWLNSVDASDSSAPPVPAADAWQWFEMPRSADVIVFDTGRETSFDVLELLTYPEGLDPSGIPITVKITPLCGPQAEVSCANASSGPTSVEISHQLIEESLDGVDYFAVGGIMLPLADAHPDSFMALLRNEGVSE